MKCVILALNEIRDEGVFTCKAEIIENLKAYSMTDEQIKAALSAKSC